MRGRRTWAWIVALTAGATAVGGTAQPARADDPSPWGVTDHSAAGVAPAAPAPSTRAAAPTRAVQPATRPKATRTAKAAAPKPATSRAATPKPATSRAATPKPAATAPRPTATAPRTTPAPRTATLPPTTPAAATTPAGRDWVVQQQPPATATPTPSATGTPSTGTPSTGVTLPAAVHADGDLDLDLTRTVTGGDPSWDRAASGGAAADWSGTVAAIAAARAGRTGTTYLRVAAPLAGTGAQAVPPATFREAWRRWSETARAAFPQAKLVLAVEAGRDSPDTLAPFWPSDGAVDVVGVNARIADPGQAGVVESLTDPRGLAAWLGFAAARGKPVGVPDWGLESGADTPDGVTFTRWMQAALGTNATTADQTAGRVVYAPLAAGPAPTSAVSARRSHARALTSPLAATAPPPTVHSSGS